MAQSFEKHLVASQKFLFGLKALPSFSEQKGNKVNGHERKMNGNERKMKGKGMERKGK